MSFLDPTIRVLTLQGLRTTRGIVKAQTSTAAFLYVCHAVDADDIDKLARSSLAVRLIVICHVHLLTLDCSYWWQNASPDYSDYVGAESLVEDQAVIGGIGLTLWTLLVGIGLGILWGR